MRVQVAYWGGEGEDGNGSDGESSDFPDLLSNVPSKKKSRPRLAQSDDTSSVGQGPPTSDDPVSELGDVELDDEPATLKVSILCSTQILERLTSIRSPLVRS